MIQHKRFEQRANAGEFRVLDAFRSDQLIGEKLSEWTGTCKIGDRFEHFTGQTYLIRVE